MSRRFPISMMQYLLGGMLCAYSPYLLAQQEVQFTQYMYNTVSVNPAYAGSRGLMDITGIYRAQWAGVTGAPKTQSLNMHAPIANSKLGYGVSVINDNIGDGTVQETYFDGLFSYTLTFGLDQHLAFGVKLGGSLLNVDFSKLSNYVEEPIATENIDNKFSPNVGVGFYYYTDRLYLGFSAPNLLETEHFDNGATDANSVSFLSTERVNFFMMAGYVMPIGAQLDWKPALLLKAVGGTPLQVDLSCSFLFQDRFMLGVSYRWDAAISGLFSFQITDQFLLGIGYDRETHELGGTQFNDGSFEVLARFEIFGHYKNPNNQRFF